MSAYILWIDSEHAKIFKLLNGKKEQKTVHKHENKNQNFFHDVSAELENSTEVLVLGPGLAKNHFLDHLKNHHHESLNKKIVGVETVDHPTDNQILEHARQFFKLYDVFH